MTMLMLANVPCDPLLKLRGWVFFSRPRALWILARRELRLSQLTHFLQRDTAEVGAQRADCGFGEGAECSGERRLCSLRVLGMNPKASRNIYKSCIYIYMYMYIHIYICIQNIFTYLYLYLCLCLYVCCLRGSPRRPAPVLQDRLLQDDVKEKGCLLDGFPRAPDQAQAMVDAGLDVEKFLVIKVGGEGRDEKSGNE